MSAVVPCFAYAARGKRPGMVAVHGMTLIGSLVVLALACMFLSASIAGAREDRREGHSAVAWGLEAWAITAIAFALAIGLGVHAFRN